ncbi:ArgE/DapE family deacylase [Phytoactinopolyspora mesophila]|uniref:Probable succinyl-diaminopimelate desuccinylase n=1 Tax=Phytoactinopolyspora mesophila TaxID=2650750 RepID=A0A7K3M8P7_9ACTN|nr:ArgE/DapE family deacylase [Phytoactinopolyspora mesophila]
MVQGQGFPVDEQGVVDFTRDLVRIRSVHEAGHERAEEAVAALVAARMRDFGWEPEVVEVAPGRPNVVAVVEGGGGDGPTLAFEGHTDVVTEGDLDTWTVDPYGAQIRDGRLYGRGSADMKSGVAAMLYGVRALQQAGPFPGRIKLCVLADEEGLMLGAKHFAASPAARDVDAAIICEPEEGEICVAAKGAIRLRVDFAGKMAHGAMPQHGRNPVAPAGSLLMALAEREHQWQSELGAHEHLGLPYVTPTVLEAGSPDQINVIPARASVCVDIRTVPALDHAQVITEVAKLAEAAGAPYGVTAEVSVVDDRPAVEIDAADPVVTALAQAHEAVTGEPARYGGVPGATDGTILTRDAGIPTVVYGPGGKWIAHQADEFVEVDDIIRCAHVYAEAAHRFQHGAAQ